MTRAECFEGMDAIKAAEGACARECTASGYRDPLLNSFTLYAPLQCPDTFAGTEEV